MDVRTLNTQTFSVVRQERAKSVEGQVVPSAKSVSFLPQTPLALLETYIATLTPGIQDAAGISLTAEHRWSFKTRDGRWGIPSQVDSEAKQGALSAQLAMDDAGSAIAVWLRREGLRMDLWSSRYTRANGWGAPEPLETDDRWSVVSPQVAMTPGGSGLALWVQSSSGSQRIWAKQYEAGSGWKDAQPISPSSQDATEPALALAPSGHAMAVWTHFDSETSSTHVWASAHVPGSGWGAAQRIEGSHSGQSYFPHVAIDETGHAIAAWVRYESGRFTVWVNRHQAGSSWASAQPIDTNLTSPASSPRVSIRQQAFVVWSQQEGNRQAIWASRFASGDGWSSARIIDSGDQNASQPRIAIDKQGNALVIWTQPWLGHIAVWANRYVAAGAGWGVAQPISSLEAADNAVCAELAMDARGHALAVWQQRDASTYPRVWSSRYVADKGWVPVSIIDDAQFWDVTCPWVAINGDGFGIAVWPQSKRRDERIDIGIASNRFE